MAKKVSPSQLIGTLSFHQALLADTRRNRRRWRVEFTGDRGARHVSDHSPLFAWGVVRPAMPRPLSGAARRRRR